MALQFFISVAVIFGFKTSLKYPQSSVQSGFDRSGMNGLMYGGDVAMAKKGTVFEGLTALC